MFSHRLGLAPVYRIPQYVTMYRYWIPYYALLRPKGNLDAQDY